jgi:hypothetical protein
LHHIVQESVGGSAKNASENDRNKNKEKHNKRAKTQHTTHTPHNAHKTSTSTANAPLRGLFYLLHLTCSSVLGVIA